MPLNKIHCHILHHGSVLRKSNELSSIGVPKTRMLVFGVCKFMSNICLSQKIMSFQNNLKTRMWFKRNMALLLMWSLFTPLAVDGQTVVVPNGQPQADQAVTSAKQAALPRELPGALPGAGVDWADAGVIYDLIGRWVRDGRVGLPGPQTHLVTNFGGMRVTLRWMGKTYGIGDSLVEPAKQIPGHKFDLLHHARNSTTAALRMLRSRLPQWSTMSAGQRASILVDLQIARTAKPLPMRSDRPTALFSPGFHGLILTAPHNHHAWSWPATNLSMNLSPQSQLWTLLRELGYEPDFKTVLAKAQTSLRFHCFSVIHLVQPAVDLPVTRLIRGQVILPPMLDGRTLTALTDRLAGHLAQRQRDNGTMAGTYRPTANRYDPLDANLEHQAMGAFAMAKWVQMDVLTRGPVEDPVVAKAIRQAVKYLLGQFDDRTIRQSPAAVAWTLRTLVADPQFSDYKQQRDELAAALGGLQREDGAFLINRREKTKPAKLADQLLILNSLIAYFEQTRQAMIKPIIDRSVLYLNQTNQAVPLQAMGLAITAEKRLSKLQWESALTLLSSSQLVDVMRQLLLYHQVMQAPQVGPSDVVGGFDLRPRRTDLPPTPDWRSAYGLWLVAGVMTDEKVARKLGLSEAELVVRGSMAARFLAQLSFTEPACFYGMGRQEMQGGIRLTPWQNLMPVRATATALLACLHLRHALIVSEK